MYIQRQRLIIILNHKIGWMTCDFMSFSTVFQSIMSGRWADDNERLCAMKPRSGLKRSLPQAGLKLMTARSVGQRLTHRAPAAPRILKVALYIQGGGLVLGKLPVPGRHTNMDYSMAMAYWACSRGCGGGWGGVSVEQFFHSPISSPFFLPLSGKQRDTD